MTTENSNNMEVLSPSATMSLERASIDSQVATAHAYPRSLEIFKKRAIGMATLDLETAESCIYSRPVGNGKVAEGASIRMAEIVAASYGNLRVAARIVEQTPRYVKCEGVAHDLESNYAGKSECMEPTVTREGNPYSESQRAVVAKACLAKAYRDAVFKVVPKALCKSILLAAEGVIRKEVATIEQRCGRVQQWLKQIKVDDARVFGVLGVKGWSEVTDDQLNTLTGLKTAINEQDTTIEEAFPVIAKSPKFADAPQPTAQAPAKPAEPPKDEKTQAPAQNAASTPAQAQAESKTQTDADDGDLAPQKEKLPEAPKQDTSLPEEAVRLSLEIVSFKKAEAENEQAAYDRFIGLFKSLCAASSVTEKQVMAFCLTNKLAKPPQKALSDLAASKIQGMAKTWATILPTIRE